ncbi:hypothetical protein [Rhodoglobus aureus]|uniref:Uncharacterized protein n=1 Tax=Rhodoglobus aureus TaxID=191497 RepID=A0ABP4GFJ8_9MICO
MRKIAADFNDLAHDGKIRVLLTHAEGVTVGERVLLEEAEEELSLEATASECDERFLYFELSGAREVLTPASGFTFYFSNTHWNQYSTPTRSNSNHRQRAQTEVLGDNRHVEVVSSAA